MTGDVNDVIPGSDGQRFWNLKKKKNSELRFGLGRSKSIFRASRGQTSSLQRGAVRDGLRWKSQDRKKLCGSLSSHVEKPKTQKGNKKFRTWTKKRVVSVSSFSDSCVYGHLWTFSVSVWICLYHVFVSWSYIFRPIYVTSYASAEMQSMYILLGTVPADLAGTVQSNVVQAVGSNIGPTYWERCINGFLKSINVKRTEISQQWSEVNGKSSFSLITRPYLLLNV